MGQCCGGAQPQRPDIECSPHDPITLTRPIRYATYGPQKNTIPHDITQTLRGFYSSGHTSIQSVEESVGNPFPGRKSVVRIWFLNEEPDQTFGEDDEVELKGFVCYATYNPADSPAYDVSEAVKDLQRRGKNKWITPTAVLGNNFPGQSGKVFKVWYNNS